MAEKLGRRVCGDVETWPDAEVDDWLGYYELKNDDAERRAAAAAPPPPLQPIG